MRPCLLTSVLLGLVACSGGTTNDRVSRPADAGAAAGSAGSGSGSDVPDTGSGGSGPVLIHVPDAAAPPTGTPCSNAPGMDGDHDGFAAGSNDCNDCDPNVNPGAYDVPGNGVDEDCNGIADDEPSLCDAGLAIDSMDPADAASALGVCRRQHGDTWGLVSAAWVFPDGTKTSLPPDRDCMPGPGPNPLSHGLLGAYGAKLVPREGHSMLAISSGVARAGDTPVPPPGSGTSPANGAMCTKSAFPDGFPKPPAACVGIATKGSDCYDGTALELQIRVPSNASAFSFDFDFNTPEYPQFVCDTFNDEFVALLWSRAPTTPADHNISFDSQGDAVSVNNAFLEVCAPTMTNGKTFTCPLGTSELEGTGILAVQGASSADLVTRGGATGWLTTTASVVAGETITVRFAIWDAGDDVLDSTTLLDHFTWRAEAGTASPQRPFTDRIR